MCAMRTSPQVRTCRGFTLVEIAVVLFIVAVLIAMAAAITRGVTAAQKRALTATRIAGVDAALLQFVSTQRRLPCPADATLGANPSFGKESGRTATGCTGTTQIHGVVPWRDLGLTEVEASDGYDRRLTYRVFSGLAADNGMDMSWCDPAGTEAGLTPRACTANACTSAALGSCTPPSAFLSTKGLRVRNVAGAVLMDPAAAPATNTGAAYVVISHGETGGGGYLLGGGLASSSTTDGTEEAKNYANLPLGAYYVSDTAVDAGGPGHFDDIVSHPSVLSVITRAGLGPRAH